jgi:hypothetical protein
VLFADEVVLGGVRVSDETIEQVRREGREASRSAAGPIAGTLGR